MKKALLLALLLAVPSFAQGVDLGVRIDVDPRQALLRAPFLVHARWQEPVAPQNAVLTVDAPGPIGSINLWDEGMECTIEGLRIRCTLPAVRTFDGGFHLDVWPTTPGTYTATATITSDTPDPNPANNTSSASIEVTGLPRLRGYAVAPDAESENALDPGRPAVLRTGIQNDGMPATNVTMRMTLPEGGSFLRVGDYVGPAHECAVTPAEVVCTWPELGHFSILQFEVHYLTPERNDGTKFPVRVELDAAEADFEPEGRVSVTNVPLRRRFLVETPADEGSGSLRQAMLDAKLQCAGTPCLIEFRTAEPVRPRSPLPELGGYVKIAGYATRGEIDGSLLDRSLVVDGHGLAGDVCELRLDNIAVRNFPRHGVEARVSHACPLYPLLRTGLFIRGSHFTGNERGIVTKRIEPVIANNEIRDNRRAGIFLDGGTKASVTGNSITGNGASGVFVNLAQNGPYYGVPSEARITNNVIRDNGEFGVARTRNGWVLVTENNIGGNALYGIDVDLDLGSPNREDDQSGVPNKPVVLSAAYDPGSDRTIVRILPDTRINGDVRLHVYASNSLSRRGYPEAEQLLANQQMLRPGEIEIAVAGDLRGKWITATLTRTAVLDWTVVPSDTSELSDAVEVR